jgi:hypothetical protein
VTAMEETAEPLLPDDEPAELEGGFSRRALGWIVGAVAGSFLISVLLGVFGKDLDRRPTPGPNTFSYSALGHKGFADFLRSMGLGVASRQSPAGGGLGPAHPLIVAEPSSAGEDRLKDLLREAGNAKAPLVLVLPKWYPFLSDPKKPEWLSRVDLRSLRDAEAAAGPLLGEEEDEENKKKRLAADRFKGGLRCSPGSGEELRIEADPVQLLKPDPRLEPVLGCPGGLLIARLKAERPVYLVADPDLLNNQGLGRGDNAAAVYRFLVSSLGATGVVFDETIHGFNRTPGLLAEALRFPMVLGVLQSLLLLGVVLWAGMGRFGKPLPAAPGLAAGKEILIDNTAKLLAGGGYAGDSLLLYFRQTTRAVAAHYFLPPDLRDGERLDRLDRLTRASGRRSDLAELEKGIHNLPPGRRGEEEAARLARRLYDWRMEMTNGDREGS